MKGLTLGSGFLTIALLSAGAVPLVRSISSAQAGLPGEVESHYSELLSSAKEKAGQNQLVEALQTVAGVPTNSDHFDEAQELQENLSQELLRAANEKYNNADFKGALALLQAIPATSSSAEQVKQQIAQLSQESQHLDEVRIAESRGQWSEALSRLEGLKGSPIYNSRAVQDLSQQLIARAFDPGASAVAISGNVGAVPRLTAPNPPVSVPRIQTSPKLAAVAVDVDSALTTTAPPQRPIAEAPPVRLASTSASAPVIRPAAQLPSASSDIVAQPVAVTPLPRRTAISGSPSTTPPQAIAARISQPSRSELEEAVDMESIMTPVSLEIDVATVPVSEVNPAVDVHAAHQMPSTEPASQAAAVTSEFSSASEFSTANLISLPVTSVPPTAVQPPSLGEWMPMSYTQTSPTTSDVQSDLSQPSENLLETTQLETDSEDLTSTPFRLESSTDPGFVLVHP